jgi:membrane-bound lytic murein transglycosylase A
MTAVDADQARRFFEHYFQAEPSPGEGVLTGYFAPVYEARAVADEVFNAPVRRKPADLQVIDMGRLDPAQAGRPGAAVVRPDGTLAPYPERAEIEQREASDALAWMRPEELFFLQIQGSGVLMMEDGVRMKVLYAANNGRPFVGIANALRDRGELPRDGVSADAIRQWLADNRGAKAEEVMRLNPRYAFFTLAKDDGKPPVGAANVPLPRGRAIAVDPLHNPLGDLFWIDAAAPTLAGAFPSYRRLVVALDTGGAIKGPVRADFYVGEGDAAGVEAGRIRHTLRMLRLAPRAGVGERGR